MVYAQKLLNNHALQRQIFTPDLCNQLGVMLSLYPDSGLAGHACAGVHVQRT